MLEKESKFQSSESDEDTNIFGKGLADNIARLPGVPYGEKNEKKESKFKHSYLSTIQSIRGMEKDKLNEMLQQQVNKLTILDQKFKKILNSNLKDK